jgi:filamentous hemagglutinin family protein
MFRRSQWWPLRVVARWVPTAPVGTTTGNATLSLGYAIRSSGSATLAAGYAIRSASQATLNSGYAIRNASSSTVDLGYAIRSASLATLAAGYAIRSASSATLNRVLDPNPSQIFGRLTAHGQVFLTNPSGIYFGRSASVDVGGLVATTHRIGSADFMAGKSVFSRDDASGSVALG